MTLCRTLSPNSISITKQKWFEAKMRDVSVDVNVGACMGS